MHTTTCGESGASGGLTRFHQKHVFAPVQVQFAFPCGAGALAREGSWKGTTSVVPQAPEKRFRHRKPASPDKKQSARSLLFLQSLRRPVNHVPWDGIILDLDAAAGKAAPRVPHVSRLSRRGIPPASSVSFSPFRSIHPVLPTRASLVETTCYSQV